ncbi:MAG: VCBS repeat-containing protein [Flavobacteriaceae bacterium]|nr:VCBS repeat-containing protein [Flavobacteriaceae bacterium]
MKRIVFVLIITFFSFACESELKQFTKLNPKDTSIDFVNKLYETNSRNYFTYPYMYLGGGVAAGDFNNDGLEDLFFSGNMVPNKLYLNQGDFQFKDISESAGIQGDNRWYSGVSLIDINKDGFLDIYIAVGGENEPNNNVLYINNQDNTFSEKAEAYGIDDDGYSMHSTFFDYDKDGDLDLYVANYPPTSFTAPVDYYKYMIDNHEDRDSDHLYRNDGDRFVDVTKESGISNFGLSLGVVASDFNNDGNPDLYISNDFNAPDFMYINNGDGTFTNEILNSLQQTSFFGMGVDAADFNNDGWVDIFQLDMNAADNFRSKANMSSMNPEVFYQSVALGLHHQYMQNSLQLNQGNLNDSSPAFSNIARWSGVSSTDWSWGGLFADFDNDGWKDLYVTNGIRRDVNNKDFYNEHRAFFNKMENDPNYKNKEEEVKLLSYLEKMPSEKLSNYLFQNQQENGFKNKNIEWGLDEKTFSNGVVYSDLDNDGDLDLVVNNLEDFASIYRNNTSNSNYIGFTLEGKDQQIPIGTRIHLKASGKYQMQELNLSRGYLSSVSPRVHFGLGAAPEIEEVIVEWPDGNRIKLEDLRVNSYNAVAYKEDSSNTLNEKNEFSEVKRFETVVQKDAFVHRENPYDDFKDEVLLPHKNSTLGPALAVGDLNNDGREDYIVGGAIAQAAEIYIQKVNGSFQKVNVPIFEKDKFYEDLGIQIFDADNDGDLDIYIASGGNEFNEGSQGYEDRFYENKGNLVFERNISAIPDTRISGLEVSVNDFDQDGDLDLFVGGRLSPKKYPYPSSSRILENRSASGSIQFVDVTEEKNPALTNIGLVTTSKWVDLDGDSWEDLVVAGEWMSIRFFKNNEGKTFKEVTEEVYLPEQRGWWYDIEKGDFDNDGDLDLIVGNLGLNYKYQASTEKPFRVYLNDFDKNATYDIVLSYKSDDTEYPVRGRQCSSEQMPAIKEKFKNYNSFASASLEEIYSDQMLEESLKYEITSFASVYLQNNDGKFIAKPLPYQAQFSNINALVVEDIDRDGNLDVVLGGNLYNAEVETPRNDASYGLWLKGDGANGFRAQAPRETGLVVRGDIRNMKPIKVGDQTHLLVAKNNQALQQIRIN